MVGGMETERWLAVVRDSKKKSVLKKEDTENKDKQQGIKQM